MHFRFGNQSSTKTLPENFLTNRIQEPSSHHLIAISALSNIPSFYMLRRQQFISNRI